MWNDAAYDVFESRNILPVSDWSKECCFVGIRKSFVTQLLVQGTSWGQQTEGKGKEEEDEIWSCSAERSSPARASVCIVVHWY